MYEILIETNEKSFTIKRKYDNAVILELERPQTIDVSQHQAAIIAKKADGSYDFYLLSAVRYSKNLSAIFVDKLSEYQFIGNLFAIKITTENCWKIFFSENLAKNLSEKNVKERLEQLPSIPYEKEHAANFKKEFETLYDFYARAYRIYFGVFTSGNSDYLITVEENDIDFYPYDIKISHLGKAELLTGGSGIFFKSANTNGHVYWHRFISKEGPYSEITELAANEYPTCFPNSEFVGYSKKDAEGNILRLTFLSRKSEQYFEVPINWAAKEVKFVQEYPLQVAYDGTISGKTEVWKVITPNDEKMLLIIFRGKGLQDRYTFINPKDLFR